MAVNLTGDRLPCGHDIDQLWDHLALNAPDAHARSCEHCQAALAEIRPLRAAVSALAAEPVRPPADLHARVMTAVRARTTAAPGLALPGPTGNRLVISEHAAAAILRAAGDTVDGVRARSCRLPQDAPDMDPGTGPDIRRATDLELSISLRFDMPAFAAARAVRAAVRTAARAQLGLTLGRIDIDVVDVHTV
jgi:hypothetical protein